MRFLLTQSVSIFAFWIPYPHISIRRIPTFLPIFLFYQTKPVEMIIEAYQAGHRHFGENYIQAGATLQIFRGKRVVPDIET